MLSCNKTTNEFTTFLRETLRKVEKNKQTTDEKIALLIYYLQSIEKQPTEELTEEKALQYMTLGWYMSSLLEENK